ncbi:MAG: glycosyltransferase family 9 protein [Ignavibacteria bacterium]|nr:glycosyltransferase family 9 protein [Ignavibacteria bacterium]
MNKQEIKSILIIKLCCLGDMVFFTPVIENLRANYPDAKITLLAAKWLKPLVPYLKFIDEVIYYEGPYESSGVKKILNTIRTILKLRAKKYDLAVLGHRNNFYGFFAKLCGIKIRLGFSGTKYLTDTVDFDKYTHTTDKNLSILEPLSIPLKNNGTSLQRIRAKEEIKKELDIPSKKNITGIFPFGGVNPGTDMDIKRWDYKNFITVINNAANENKDNIVIVFEGRDINEKIPSSVIFPSNVLLKTIDIDSISVCDVFICGDTGPLHIAAAFGIPTVALFGPSDADFVKPLSSDNTQHILIWKKPWCSPCYNPVTAAERDNPKYWQNGVFRCHTGTLECMKSITVEEVTASINKLNLNK